VPGIQTYCHIRNNRVYLDGKLAFEGKEAAGLHQLAAQAYRHFRIKYPKFHKMDDISKLGFLGAELMIRNRKEEVGPDTAVILSNASSTLVTDSAFQKSINSYEHFFPSPSVFVYTLPNIMIGEISIRHQLRGENAFFIFDRFNGAFLTDYINLLFQQRKVNNCIGGWVEQSDKDYEAFMYFVGRDDSKALTGHKGAKVMELYKNI
jgi:hypothetical protein